MSEKVAGQSYILVFYRDVILLTHYISLYLNMIIEIDFKYSDFDLGKLDPAEKNQVISNIQNLRYYTNKCFIEYQSIKRKIGYEEADDLEIARIHEELNRTGKFVILKEDAEKYAELMNKLLVNDVIQNLLETSQDLMQQLYGEAEPQSTTSPS